MKEFVIKITHGKEKKRRNIGTRHAPSNSGGIYVYFIFIHVDYFHKIIIIELFVIKWRRERKNNKI